LRSALEVQIFLWRLIVAAHRSDKMDEGPPLLFHYAPTLRYDDGSEIGFEGMEAIRRPYRRRARLVSAIRAIGVVLSWFGLITLGTAHLLKENFSALPAIAAFCAATFFTLSPLFYASMRVSIGLPPLPKELQKQLGRLQSGEVTSISGGHTVPTSQFGSPFTVMLTSDVDHDWVYSPDHRLRYLRKPVQLLFPTTSGHQQTQTVAPNIPTSIPFDSNNVAELDATGKANAEQREALENKTNDSKSSRTDWLKQLKWWQVVHGLPKMLSAEEFYGDNRKRVELAVRWGRVALRGKTSFNPGLTGAKKAVIEAIGRQLDENGKTMQTGLNGTASDEWIRQLLLGRYHDGRIKDHLMGRPHLPLDYTGSSSDN
jgi:hypothetical protein